MKTIAQEFAEHCRTVYPPELLARMGDDNLEELRRTFYIGYKRAWDRVQAATGGQLPEGEVVALVQATALELGLFFEALRKPVKAPPIIDGCTTWEVRKNIDPGAIDVSTQEKLNRYIPAPPKAHN